MTFFQFQNSAFFALLLLLPILAWWAGRMGPEAAMRFSSTALARAVSRERRSQPGKFLFGLRLLALAAIITALARPQIGRMNESTEADGIDIVVTLDLSGSMSALDLSTQEEVVTRLDAAKRVVDDFIGKREYDRIGLVAFAADAYVVTFSDWNSAKSMAAELPLAPPWVPASIDCATTRPAVASSFSSRTARTTPAHSPPSVRRRPPRLTASKFTPSLPVKRAGCPSRRPTAAAASSAIARGAPFTRAVGPSPITTRPNSARWRR
jgi:hypothetical protein